MKHILLAFLITLLSGVLVGTGASYDFKQSFTHPPAEARPWVYWYWMNGNITSSGALEDLRALHRVGVGGAYLMDIGIHPTGPVSYRSTAWYDVTKAVMAEAATLGMHIGFHCPGWSASGGPWITPDLAMQEVVWTETTVVIGKGGNETGGAVQLPRPEPRLDTYKDIAVIAIPSSVPDGNLFARRAFKVMAGDKEIRDAAAAFDGKPDTHAVLPLSFEIVFEEPIRVRSVFFRGARDGGDFTGRLEVRDANGIYVEVARLEPAHPGPFSSRQGAAAFEAVGSARFRFSFSGTHRDRMLLEELSMTGGYRLDDWPELAGFGTKAMGDSTLKVRPSPEDIIPSGKVLDLTDSMDAYGMLRRLLPEGGWTVLRFGFVPTAVGVKPAPAGGEGLECDKMSAEAADYHYNRMIGPLLSAYGKEVAGKTLARYHVDSYEPGWQNWTPKMPEEFLNRRGYALLPYLPALTGRVIADVDTTLKFLWDFRRTIGDLYADNHYGRLAERAHRDGLRFSTEPYGGPFEFLQIAGRADYPMVEFWTGPRNVLPAEQAGGRHRFHGVMGAHTYGKRIIGSEAFTSEEGWIMHPYAIKSLGDVMFASGVNQFIIHVCAHQPYLREGTYPGFTSGINGIHFDRGNTWFDHGGREWVDYLRRCQGVLQQGLHVADVLYFQGDDSPWAGTLMSPPLPAGYDGDTINAEILRRLRVANGALVLPGGKTYSYLVMPQHGRMTYVSLREVDRLLQAGATVLGPRPVSSPSLADAPHRERYAALAGSLWDGSTTLKGRVLKDRSMADVFAHDGLPPDFVFSSDDGLVLHYNHRRDGRRDVYFVANGLKQAGRAVCEFRTDGGRPELWYPVDGKTRDLAEYGVLQDGRISIPLWFNPSDSFFVVFDRVEAARSPCVVRVDHSADMPRPELSIVRATYGAAGDRGEVLNVTAEVRTRVKDGQLDLTRFEHLKGDPVPGVVKTIRVDYSLDGKPGTVTANDGGRIRIPVPAPKQMCELFSRGGKTTLQAYENGVYTIRGQRLDVCDVPPARIIAGEWTVSFRENRGAPASIRTRELKSLPEFDDQGVRHFSGTATYAVSFGAALPVGTSRVYLDLGQVEVIASARLNGKHMGLSWKPPFRFDVTDVLREGHNELEVAVTTTWVNRLIADELFADDCTPGGNWRWGGQPGQVPEWLAGATPRAEPRLTYAAFKFWKADDPLHPAGLIGPVRILAASEVTVPSETGTTAD